MQKVPVCDDRDVRNPEPMHTTGNETTALTVMARGGTAGIYSVARLREVAEWEIALNNNGRPSRWEQQLRPYLTGMLLASEPPLCTSNQL